MSSVVRAVKALDSLLGTKAMKAPLASKSFYKFAGVTGLLAYAGGFKLSNMNIEQGRNCPSSRREVSSFSLYIYIYIYIILW